ncbi:hypothetical protein ABZ135_34715 [Streptomyces sp. NPDC006339]|uniref:helix-turn-helix domain-containing protein n=1 Tax=Streptomyces sp. NPDC006339 TaxID=3156755 RepID=UPI0033B134DB
MTTARREAPHHRNLYCVKQFGCQRPECRARANTYTRNRYRQVGYGTWQALVDVEPVRAHIAELRAAGASTPAIAKAANVSTATLARVVYGTLAQRPNPRMRAESAKAILAVRAEDCPIPDGARVDATGTRRRLQALVAMGWSFTALHPQIGIHSRPLGDMARARHVTAGSARKVKAAYKRLILMTPEQGGVPSHARALARRVASREGWVLPGAWDDIDDPTCTPDIGPADPVNRDDIAAYRKSEIARLNRYGVAEHEIAERLGMSTHYVHDLIRGMGKAA